MNAIYIIVIIIVITMPANIGPRRMADIGASRFLLTQRQAASSTQQGASSHAHAHSHAQAAREPNLQVAVGHPYAMLDSIMKENNSPNMAWPALNHTPCLSSENIQRLQSFLTGRRWAKQNAAAIVGHQRKLASWGWLIPRVFFCGLRLLA